MQNKIFNKLQYLAVYLTQANGARGVNNSWFEEKIGRDLFKYNKDGPGVADSATAGGLIISVISIMLVVAASIATIFLIYGGFKYIIARGNEEDAESAKKTMTSAVLGLVIIILAFVIIRLVASVLIEGRAGLNI